ncbi:unnamed protein product [Amoebophrya sp. A120]|nr:unnamed protein product [Amoebophrya sp. A120]|eukprot:GSA120T00025888001.1
MGTRVAERWPWWSFLRTVVLVWLFTPGCCFSSTFYVDVGHAAFLTPIQGLRFSVVKRHSSAKSATVIHQPRSSRPKPARIYREQPGVENQIEENTGPSSRGEHDDITLQHAILSGVTEKDVDKGRARKSYAPVKTAESGAGPPFLQVDVERERIARDKISDASGQEEEFHKKREILDYVPVELQQTVLELNRAPLSEPGEDGIGASGVDGGCVLCPELGVAGPVLTVIGVLLIISAAIAMCLYCGGDDEAKVRAIYNAREHQHHQLQPGGAAHGYGYGGSPGGHGGHADHQTYGAASTTTGAPGNRWRQNHNQRDNDITKLNVEFTEAEQALLADGFTPRYARMLAGLVAGDLHVDDEPVPPPQGHRDLAVMQRLQFGGIGNAGELRQLFGKKVRQKRENKWRGAQLNDPGMGYWETALRADGFSPEAAKGVARGIAMGRDPEFILPSPQWGRDLALWHERSLGGAECLAEVKGAFARKKPPKREDLAVNTIRGAVVITPTFEEALAVTTAHGLSPEYSKVLSGILCVTTSTNTAAAARPLPQATLPVDQEVLEALRFAPGDTVGEMMRFLSPRVQKKRQALHMGAQATVSTQEAEATLKAAGLSPSVASLLAVKLAQPGEGKRQIVEQTQGLIAADKDALAALGIGGTETAAELRGVVAAKTEKRKKLAEDLGNQADLSATEAETTLKAAGISPSVASLLAVKLANPGDSKKAQVETPHLTAADQDALAALGLNGAATHAEMRGVLFAKTEKRKKVARHQGKMEQTLKEEGLSPSVASLLAVKLANPGANQVLETEALNVADQNALAALGLGGAATHAEMQGALFAKAETKKKVAQEQGKMEAALKEEGVSPAAASLLALRLANPAEAAAKLETTDLAETDRQALAALGLGGTETAAELKGALAAKTKKKKKKKVAPVAAVVPELQPAWQPEVTEVEIALKDVGLSEKYRKQLATQIATAKIEPGTAIVRPEGKDLRILRDLGFGEHETALTLKLALQPPPVKKTPKRKVKKKQVAGIGQQPSAAIPSPPAPGQDDDENFAGGPGGKTTTSKHTKGGAAPGVKKKRTKSLDRSDLSSEVSNNSSLSSSKRRPKKVVKKAIKDSAGVTTAEDDTDDSTKGTKNKAKKEKLKKTASGNKLVGDGVVLQGAGDITTEEDEDSTSSKKTPKKKDKDSKKASKDKDKLRGQEDGDDTSGGAGADVRKKKKDKSEKQQEKKKHAAPAEKADLQLNLQADVADDPDGKTPQETAVSSAPLVLKARKKRKDKAEKNEPVLTADSYGHEARAVFEQAIVSKGLTPAYAKKLATALANPDIDETGVDLPAAEGADLEVLTNVMGGAIGTTTEHAQLARAQFIKVAAALPPEALVEIDTDLESAPTEAPAGAEAEEEVAEEEDAAVGSEEGGIASEVEEPGTIPPSGDRSSPPGVEDGSVPAAISPPVAAPVRASAAERSMLEQLSPSQLAEIENLEKMYAEAGFSPGYAKQAAIRIVTQDAGVIPDDWTESADPITATEKDEQLVAALGFKPDAVTTAHSKMDKFMKQTAQEKKKADLEAEKKQLEEKRAALDALAQPGCCCRGSAAAVAALEEIDASLVLLEAARVALEAAIAETAEEVKHTETAQGATPSVENAVKADEAKAALVKQGVDAAAAEQLAEKLANAENVAIKLTDEDRAQLAPVLGNSPAGQEVAGVEDVGQQHAASSPQLDYGQLTSQLMKTQADCFVQSLSPEAFDFYCDGKRLASSAPMSVCPSSSVPEGDGGQHNYTGEGIPVSELTSTDFANFQPTSTVDEVILSGAGAALSPQQKRKVMKDRIRKQHEELVSSTSETR